MNLDAKEIVTIIKACRTSNVEMIKFEGMEIHFRTRDGVQVKAKKVDATKPPTDQELEEVEKEVSLVEQANDAEDELEIMRVENPALFEQLLVERAFKERGGRDGEEIND